MEMNPQKVVNPTGNSRDKEVFVTANCFNLSFCVTLSDDGDENKPKLYEKLPSRSSAYRQICQLLPSYHDDKNLVVYVIKVCHITHLASVHPIYEGSNPFVVIRLESNDPSVNEQIQRSSYKPITTSPEWYPPERFLFYTYQADTTLLSQLHFTIYSLPGFSESVENIKNLGTMSLALNSILETEKDFTLPLYDANGSLNGAQLKISAQRMSLEKANSYKEVIVYEYERWQPIIGWCTYLLPTDPGRWSDMLGMKFADDLTKIVDPIAEGWTGGSFEVMSTNKDPRGWEYAVDFDYTDWYPSIGSQTYVRRRIWRAEVSQSEKLSTTGVSNSSRPTTPSPSQTPPSPAKFKESKTVSPAAPSSTKVEEFPSESVSPAALPSPAKVEELPTESVSPVAPPSPAKVEELLTESVSPVAPPSPAKVEELPTESVSSAAPPSPTKVAEFPSESVGVYFIPRRNSETPSFDILTSLSHLPDRPEFHRILEALKLQSCQADSFALPMIRLQYLGDQTDLLTFYSSVTALRKLDSLVVENEQSYLQTTQLLLCPVSNNSLPTLEISDIVMNSNKDVELLGSMDPFLEIDCYTDHTTPWWSYQTTVQEGAGKSAKWEINQLIAMKYQEENDTSLPNTLRIRIKDKNSTRKDTLVGKSLILCNELQSSDWTSYSLPMKDKKGKLCGNVMLTYRYYCSRNSMNQSDNSFNLLQFIQDVQYFPIFLYLLPSGAVYDPEGIQAICTKYGLQYKESKSQEQQQQQQQQQQGSQEFQTILLAANTRPDTILVDQSTFQNFLHCIDELAKLN